MITLAKEIKAYTVLENTPAVFKMEAATNNATTLEVTVDRTSKTVTATKEGKNIHAPFAKDSIIKILNKEMENMETVKCNAQDEKQVLTNDTNTNNEVETMENKKLMAKVASLYTENTGSRVRNVQLSVESSIIRQAFGIKNGEIDTAIKTPKKVENFKRGAVLTEKQITNKYMEYIGFYKWAKATDSNGRYDAEIKLEYFVKGVEFFNKSLAEKLKQIAI